jgi:FixJ family two-component response regulator
LSSLLGETWKELNSNSIYMIDSFPVAAGFSNQEIAQDLVIAVSTVKKHLYNIYGKLEVGNRTQAVAKARELGLL